MPEHKCYDIVIWKFIFKIHASWDIPFHIVNDFTFQFILKPYIHRLEHHRTILSNEMHVKGHSKKWNEFEACKWYKGMFLPSRSYVQGCPERSIQSKDGCICIRGRIACKISVCNMRLIILRYIHTVLPRLVRRRTIKLSSFSRGALSERAY